jgi:hypothetical protein
MRTRTLVLRREALADLTANDLADVVGGAQTSDCPDYTYPCGLTGQIVCGASRFPLCA